MCWEVVEPKQGSFDFSGVDAIVKGAREQGLHLILSWFGTWKNGAMTYVPGWMKENPVKYPLVIDAAGNPVDGLSAATVIVAPAAEAGKKPTKTIIKKTFGVLVVGQ